MTRKKDKRKKGFVIPAQRRKHIKRVDMKVEGKTSTGSDLVFI